MTANNFPPAIPAITLSSSRVVNLDAEGFHFDLPPGSATMVTLKSSLEPNPRPRAVLKASPEVSQELLEAEAPGQDGAMGVPSLSRTTRRIGRKPIDIAFNGGKIHNIQFNCNDIGNISFNGGNVRSVSFGPPLGPNIEDDKAPKASEPEPDHTSLSQPHSLIIQLPSIQKSIESLRLEGGAIVLHGPEDLGIRKLHVVTLIGRSDLGNIRVGRASLRIEGGTMEAEQVRCDDFKAVVQAGCLRAPTAERSSITVISGCLRVKVSESATAQCDIVVISGKAYVEVPTTFEGELNCDASGGRIVRDGETLPGNYGQRAVNDR